MSEKINLFERLVELYKSFIELYYENRSMFCETMKDYACTIIENFELLIAYILFELYMYDKAVFLKKDEEQSDT